VAIQIRKHTLGIRDRVQQMAIRMKVITNSSPKELEVARNGSGWLRFLKVLDNRSWCRDKSKSNNSEKEGAMIQIH